MPAIHSMQALYAMQRQAQPRGDTTKHTSQVWTGRIHAALMQATSEPPWNAASSRLQELQTHGLPLHQWPATVSHRGNLPRKDEQLSDVTHLYLSDAVQHQPPERKWPPHESARGCYSKRHLDGAIRRRDDKYCKLHITMLVGPYNMFCIGEKPTHDRRFDDDMKDKVNARKTSSTRSNARITN